MSVMSSFKAWWYIVPAVAVAGAFMTGGLGLSKEARFPGGIDNSGNCVNFSHKRLENWRVSKGRLDITTNLCPGTRITLGVGTQRLTITHLPRRGEPRATTFFTSNWCRDARSDNDPDLSYCILSPGFAGLFAPGSYEKIDKWPAGLRIRITSE